MFSTFYQGVETAWKLQINGIVLIGRVWTLQKRNLDELERTLGTRLMLVEFTDQVAAHLDETLQGTSCPFFLVFTSSESTASFPVVLGDSGCDVTCQACREN